MSGSPGVPGAAWTRGPAPPAAARRLEAAAALAFSPAGEAALGPTLSILAVHRGRLVFERYGAGVGAHDPLPSWSMAKSVTHALVGLLVGDGRLDPGAPAAAPEWAGPGDPRGAIRLEDLLRMSSGLRFKEVYVEGQGSDVIEMLFGGGKADVGAFAAAFPLDHPPGAAFAYSSGTTNIVCRIVRDLLGGEAALRAYLEARLFGPLGMRTPRPRFDASGTFIGSSYCDCSAGDFARFGLLYLRGGVWNGARILPEGWTDHARALTPASEGSPDGAYGAHWWLGTGGPGTFAALGYEGQFIVVAPEADLVLVRNGRSPLERKEPLAAFVRELAEGLAGDLRRAA